ncbi:armadillo-type protein [Lineolata rhizophorae]|uniref:Armadillo-type protein n=1 Tax=Lineolata rhizophorae TaxID=578093 RepID=A0A6A6P9C7_9PEZI|nr:armadillo-type protein [Lineolata rhizophorae]
MAEEEDFSQLPLQDRFAHKNWKVRKEGYEAAKKEFDNAASEGDPIVRQFIQDAGLWKGAVADSNVAAQQEGLAALCAFLQIAGPQGCVRTRNITITPIAEKGLSSTRPAAKERSLEALMLYIELDKPDPVIDELLPMLSHKQPKLITATLNALTSIFHAYGCKTIEPKPTLKALPKVFGHADKNVRAAAQDLTVEFYRWLKEAMKPLFWNELKPVQQQDLDKLFEKVKDEPPPKQERLLRSQQAAKAAADAHGGGGGDTEADGGEEEEAEIDLEPEYEPVDVFPKIPKDLQDRLSSSKWKDRKEALDDLQAAINHPRIQEGPFDDILRALAKCMKDANIAVVTVAANCIEILAKGLKRSFAKYRNIVLSPMMERLKEKKQSVADAIGSALDAVFMATSISDNLDEILGFLTHKNPQVKLESTRFLIRCLKTTKEAPDLPEAKSIAEAATKLLTDSQEVQRSAGAEVLGILWKIMGDRVMNAHLDGLDDIRKTKIKEYYESTEVKAKYKPKSAPAPKAAAGGTKRLGGPPTTKRPATSGVKKPAAPPAAAPPVEEPASAPLAPRPTSRPGGVPKLGAKSGLAKPGGGLRPPAGRPPAVSSPKRQTAPPPQPVEEPPQPAPVPAPSKMGLPGRGLAQRPLGKPQAAAGFGGGEAGGFGGGAGAPNGGVVGAPSGLSAIERAELEELRAEVERMRRQTEELRSERSKLHSQVTELQNQNAQLIEDHTRDVLSIKAKETQLVRARSDAEAAEQTVQQQQREVDRLKRELARQVRATSPAPLDVSDMIGQGGSNNNSNLSGGGSGGGYGATSPPPSYNRRPYASSHASHASLGSATGEGKENNFGLDGHHARQKLGSPPLGQFSSSGSSAGGAEGNGRSGSGFGGRASPALAGGAPGGGQDGQGGAESWKRAAEVTQNLKARIELMKQKQGMGSRQQHQ